MERMVQEIKQQKRLRENLIKLRERLREGADVNAALALIQQEDNALVPLLRHEDPKVRRNAALLLGDLGCQEQIQELFQAYWSEGTLFVRADYLRALQQLSYEEYLPMLQQRLSQMMAQEAPEDGRKHQREEILQLGRMLRENAGRERRQFCGMGQIFDIALITNRLHREVTATQIRGCPVTLLPMGVRAAGAKPEALMQIRTFREMLFFLNVQDMGPGPEECARALADSDLWSVAQRGLGKMESCCFRITVVGDMDLEQRSAFTKRCGYELERRTARQMQNAPGDYDVELCFYQRKSGSFLPLVKFPGLNDTRFAYRKRMLPVSMHPATAALMAVMAKPYLRERARTLDPFCGVGTMLIERNLAVPAGAMYGVDIYGDAIAAAQENARAAGRKIYFIQRDFMDFTHEHMFDEIFTDMPMRGKKSKEEQDQLYAGFFRAASRLLAPGGIVVMYSNERGHVRKQLRLHGEFQLCAEHSIREKGDFAIYVIRKGA